MKKDDKEKTITLAKKMADAEKYCFAKHSTEKWVKMFSKKKFQFLVDIEEVEYEDEKTTDEARRLFTKEFTKLIMEYIESLPEKKEEKEKN